MVHKNVKQKIARMKLTVYLILMALVAVCFFLMPVSVDIHIKTPKSLMPPFKAGSLTINGDIYQMGPADTVMHLKGLPGYYRGRKLHVEVNSLYFDRLDTVVNIGAGLGTDASLDLRVSDEYSTYSGTVFTSGGTPIGGAKVTIGSQETLTNALGDFIVKVPETERALTKVVTVTCDGYQPNIRPEETPGAGYQYVMKK